MAQLMTALWADESGFILTAELVLVGTIVVLGLVTGLVCVRDAITCELTDVAHSIRSLDQSYYFSGMRSWSWCGWHGMKSWTAGSYFVDISERTAVGQTVIEHRGVIQQDFVCPMEEKMVAPAPCLTVPAPDATSVPCAPASPACRPATNAAPCSTDPCGVAPSQSTNGSPASSIIPPHAEPLVW